MVFRGNTLEIKLGLVSWLNPHPNHLQMTNVYPHSKRGNLYTQSAHKSWIHYYVIFLVSFAIRGGGATTMHLPHGFTPQGVHCIVKLNTMCKQKKSTFSKLHHQNRSEFYQFISWVDIHYIYYIIKNDNQIWWYFNFLMNKTYRF